MPNYTINIELFNPGSEDYSLLKTRMESAGFTRTIPSYSNAYYILPCGMFSYNGHCDLNMVSESVRDIATSINKHAKNFVAMSAGCRWFNLNKALNLLAELFIGRRVNKYY